jgi:uncharacterized membrane protein
MRRLVAGLLVLIVGVAAWAQPDAGDARLSAAQRQALRGIRQRYEGRRQDVQLRLQTRRLELAQMLRQDGADKPALQNKLDEILELEKQRQHLFLDEIFEAKTQLSAEQWGPFRQRVLRHLLEDHRPGGGRRGMRQSP